MAKWNSWNLLPDYRWVGHAVAEEAQNKMICFDAAGGSTAEYERLYNDVAASHAYELWALRRSWEWQE